ncbi:MAG: hypothetical protein IJM15_04930, partial [Erysipelotrichaceae bacterium]|nr:hypothetical protein [Erysipelotrichaceae bacterium]
RVLDQFGNPAPYCQLPVSFETEGDITLIGPSVATLEGGCSGTFVKTKTAMGKGRLIIKAEGLKDETVDFKIG